MDYLFVFGLLFTYIVAPIILYALISGFIGRHQKEHYLIIALSAAFAPALISRIIIFELKIAPGYNSYYYIGVVLLFFLSMLIYSWSTYNKYLLYFGDLLYSIKYSVRIVAYFMPIFLFIFYILINEYYNNYLLSYFYIVYYGLMDGHGWPSIMPLYVLFVLVSVIILSFILFSYKYNESRYYKDNICYRVVSLLLNLIFFIIFLLSCYIVFYSIIYENDAMQYYKVSSILYNSRSLAQYPLVPAASDGTFASSAHPLGHYGALIWSYMLAGHVTPGPGKVWTLYSMLATCGLIWAVLARYGSIPVLIACIFTIAAPGYFFQLQGTGIDPQRQMLVFAAVVALTAASRSQRPIASMALAGAGAGLALQSHSQSLVLVAIALAVAIAFMPGGWRRRFVAGAAAIGMALLFGGEQYVANLMAFGSLTNNDHAIWTEVPELRYRDWRLGVAQRTDIWGKLGSGAFLGFSWWYFFSLTWWLALTAVLVRAGAIWRDPQLRNIAAVWIMAQGFLVLFFGFTASGELLVMNYRYALAFHPLPAVLAGFLVGALVARSWGWWTPLGVSAGLSTVLLSVAQVLTVQLPQLKYAVPIALTATPAEELAALPAQPGPSQFSEMEAIKELKQKTPSDAKFLVFNMNAFAYYADRRFIRDVDPRMIPFYRARTKREAVAFLRELEVDYIYIQPWSWPTVDNSLIKSVVADSSLATLVLEKYGYRVFRLERSD